MNTFTAHSRRSGEGADYEQIHKFRNYDERFQMP